jgi:hypothetical protein
VNGTRATLAIVRREMDARWLTGLAVALSAGVAFGVLSPATTPAIAGLACATLLCAVEATLRVDVRDGMYFAAPLYGRQLARAHALVALAGALALPVGAVAGWTARGTIGGEFASAGFALPLLYAAAVSGIVALSATPRTGVARFGYAVLAVVAGAATLVPAFTAMRDATTAGLAAAAVIGFFGLRAFGETLARYDPI